MKHDFGRLLASAGGLCLVLLFLPGFNGCPGPAEEPDQCVTAADCQGLPSVGCEGSWSCENGMCAYACKQVPEPTGCTSDAECPGGYFCELQPCSASDAKKPGPGGAAEAPFVEPELCGQCKKKPVPEPGCKSDADCGPGKYCDFVSCGPEGMPAPCACDSNAGDCACAKYVPDPACEGVCKPKWIPGECYSDEDCKEGELCAILPCDFTADAAEWIGCPGTCEPAPEEWCTSDGDCKKGFVCQIEACTGACMCEAGADCDCAPSCVGKCVPAEPVYECESDADCKPGWACQIETCGGCEGAAPYPDGGDGDTDAFCKTTCFGYCVPKNPEYDCSSDEDCKPGHLCVLQICSGCVDMPGNGEGDPAEACMEECFGYCVPEEPAYECSSDADCKAGYHCQIEYCGGCGGEAPPGWNGDGDEPAVPCLAECWGTCVEDENPEYECMSDADCKPGSKCQIQVCEACACAPGYDCDCAASQCYGYCVPEEPQWECENDADCGPNAYCQWECWDYCAECKEDEPCFCAGSCGGICIELPPVSCGEDAACPAGQECKCMPDPSCPYCAVCLMQCVPVEPEPGCYTDADCAKGEQCVTPPCFMWCEADDASCCGPGTCVPKEEPKCVVSGCSGEICAKEPMESICIWQDWFECLKLATCEAQPTGSCGWTQTPAFEACLKKYLTP